MKANRRRRKLRPPILTDGSYVHSAEHVLTLDGKNYDMARAFKWLGKFEPVWIALGVLTWFGNMTSKRSCFSEKRLRVANTKYPLIITPDGEILDGRHRFVKMKRAGRVRARVYFLTARQLKRFECSKYKGKLVR